LGVHIQRVLTDNGSAYRSQLFARACQALGIKHSFTRPYRPQTNGKAERFIQTCLREWAYARSYPNSAARTSWLPAFLAYYNSRRPHSALGYRPPASRLDENNLLQLNSVSISTGYHPFKPLRYEPKSIQYRLCNPLRKTRRKFRRDLGDYLGCRCDHIINERLSRYFNTTCLGG
jgi:hypothetical protein